jgi:hypothetical protein
MVLSEVISRPADRGRVINPVVEALKRCHGRLW